MLYRNMSQTDRIIRIVLSSVFIYVGFFQAERIGDVFLAYFLGGFGVLNLVVAILAICPVYAIAGISTRHGDD